MSPGTSIPFSRLIETQQDLAVVLFPEGVPVLAEMIPFEQAKIRLMEAVRTEYLDDYRTRYLFKLVPEPIQIEEGAVEAMVKRHFGENLEELPDFLR